MSAQHAILARFARRQREDAALALGGARVDVSSRLDELEAMAVGWAAQPSTAPRDWRAYVVAVARSYGLDEMDAEMVLADAVNAAGSLR